MPPRRRATQDQALLTHGVRSGLEGAIADQLRTTGTGYLYEEVPVPFVQPVKPRRYTPDFILPNGIIVETKGRFITADRQKHLLVKAQHPQLDLRFVFSNARQRISKQSLTTYGAWCDTKGFQHATGSIPAAWITERVNRASQDAILSLLEGDSVARAKALKLFGRTK